MLDTLCVKQKVEELIAFAKCKLGLLADDEQYVRNQILDLLKLDAPTEVTTSFSENYQEDILDPILDYAVEAKLCDKFDEILFETRLLGLVTPMPSAIRAEFSRIANSKDIKSATDWLFKLCKDNNYIRLCDINKNIIWNHNGSRGDLTVTINLSKPEKDPKQIAAAKLIKKSGYPACMLCPTNEGFAGHANHPARQTLRIIPISVNDEKWFLQFSPYQYYDQHIIAFSDEHRPMKVNADCFRRLADFVGQFPHYFLGSNAALPIVGGSILTHDHYQGGNKVLPMFKVPTRHEYACENNDTQVFTIDWYNSVVRVQSKNKENMLATAVKVLDTWADYSDESVGVLHHTTDQHNAITPIARCENGVYIMDMILRNNRTDEAHPYGIFHPTEDLHNIKKEGIGIIEVMGIFILPGRLKAELADVKKYLTGESALDFCKLNDSENPLNKHAGMIANLTKEYGVANSADEAENIVNNYINSTCEKILECTAVFKNDEIGQSAFERFMSDGLGFKKK